MFEILEIANQIERIVASLAEDYKDCQGLLLTEDDLKCHLFSRLFQIPEIRHPLPSFDPHISASFIHSELSWFDKKERLTIKPDITILDPSGLSILRGINLPLPQKGCQSISDAIIIELKFCRNKTGVSKQFIKGVKKDVIKLKRLMQFLRENGGSYRFFSFLIIFAKVSKNNRSLSQVISKNQQENFKIIFHSGDVQFLES